MIQKKIILIISLLITLISNGQTKFTLTQDESKIYIPEEYVIIPMEGKTAEELYRLTSNAVQEIFVDPKERQLGTIEDKFIRINFSGGYADYSKFSCNPGCSWSKRIDSYFSFRFKDNKIRIDLGFLDNYYPFPTKNNKGKSIVKHYGAYMTGLKKRTDKEGFTFLEANFVSYYNKFLDDFIGYINKEGEIDDW